MFINLTKHPISFYNAEDVVNGTAVAGAQPYKVIVAGTELRASYNETPSEEDGVPVKTKVFAGFNIELPPSGKVIVSFQCVLPLKEQAGSLEVYTVDGIVKDADGKVIGCTSLVKN